MILLPFKSIIFLHFFLSCHLFYFCFNERKNVKFLVCVFIHCQQRWFWLGFISWSNSSEDLARNCSCWTVFSIIVTVIIKAVRYRKQKGKKIKTEVFHLDETLIELLWYTPRLFFKYLTWHTLFHVAICRNITLFTLDWF